MMRVIALCAAGLFAVATSGCELENHEGLTTAEIREQPEIREGRINQTLRQRRINNEFASLMMTKCITDNVRSLNNMGSHERQAYRRFGSQVSGLLDELGRTDMSLQLTYQNMRSDFVRRFRSIDRPYVERFIDSRRTPRVSQPSGFPLGSSLADRQRYQTSLVSECVYFGDQMRSRRFSL